MRMGEDRRGAMRRPATRAPIVFLLGALAALLLALLAAWEMLRMASAQATDPSDPVLVGTGDIADDLPSALGDNHTAQLVQTRWPEATVFANGDLAYERGTLDRFDTYYHDSDPLTQYAWGESLGDQIKPVPGNHEYLTPNAEGYFAYFARQGVPVGDGPTNARGYYHYDLGPHWRVIALNSGDTSAVPVSSGSPQYAWLEARLKEAYAAGKNVVAYFHHPLYSSGSEHGWRNSTSTNRLPCSAPSIPRVKPLWDLLYSHGADLIVQAHDHSYERFVPMNPDGTTADANGPDARPNPITSFVVGSGGKNLKPNGDQFPLDYNGDCGPLRPQSAKFLYDKFGVLKLTLHQSSFDFEYVQTTDGTDAIVTDSGMGVPVNPGAAAADTTAPTVSIATPPEGATYTLGQEVNADYTCAEENGGSGLASCEGPVPNGNPIDTSSTGTKTFTVTATDNAGNTNSASHTYSVVDSPPPEDTTAPKVSIATPAEGATYSLNQAVNADYSCQDEAGGSGLVSCQGTVASGSPIDTASVGTKTFTVTATDNAGNTSSLTHTYSVAESPPPATCTITGTSTGNTLTGTSGADVICGLGGNDTIKGLEGNDILRGDDGNDTLVGGPGNDTLDGALGTDTANFSGALAAITASLSANTATGEGSDTLTGVENLVGSSKDDALTGSEAINTINGGSGADTLDGLGGADKLTGGGGNDTEHGGLGNDSVVGSGGADNLFGDENDDAVNSKDGVNGNDSLDGGPGTDKKVTDATEKSIVGFP